MIAKPATYPLAFAVVSDTTAMPGDRRPRETRGVRPRTHTRRSQTRDKMRQRCLGTDVRGRTCAVRPDDDAPLHGAKVPDSRAPPRRSGAGDREDDKVQHPQTEAVPRRTQKEQRKGESREHLTTVCLTPPAPWRRVRRESRRCDGVISVDAFVVPASSSSSVLLRRRRRWRKVVDTADVIDDASL